MFQIFFQTLHRFDLFFGLPKHFVRLLVLNNEIDLSFVEGRRFPRGRHDEGQHHNEKREKQRIMLSRLFTAVLPLGFVGFVMRAHKIRGWGAEINWSMFPESHRVLREYLSQQPESR